MNRLVSLSSIIFLLWTVQAKCYNRQQIAKKFKHKDNCIKFISMHCSKLKSKRIKSALGTKVMSLDDDGFKTIDLHRFPDKSQKSVHTYRDYDAKHVALEINGSNCIVDNISAGFLEHFDVIHACYLAKDALILLKAHIPEPFTLEKHFAVFGFADYPHLASVHQAKQVDDIVFGIAYALKVLHNKNIAHRNLSLSTVLVNQYGKPVLSDLKYVAVEADQVTDVVGAKEYTDPYLLRHAGNAMTADVYAFGLVAFQVVNGLRSSVMLKKLLHRSGLNGSPEEFMPDLSELPFPGKYFWIGQCFFEPKSRVSIDAALSAILMSFPGSFVLDIVDKDDSEQTLDKSIYEDFIKKHLIKEKENQMIYIVNHPVQAEPLAKYWDMQVNNQKMEQFRQKAVQRQIIQMYTIPKSASPGLLHYKLNSLKHKYIV